MKIQCDVCANEEASVFCCADEAALCAACDRRVHRANKLAGKHRRFSLLSPSSSSPPTLCDVCQERRGILFCQEDRAILCRDCDAPIHTANHLTMKHSRFLLTGVRLSSAPIPSSSPSPPPPPPPENITNNSGSNSSERSSSSISEYLIKMLPGYRVEDLLVDDAVTAAATANEFYKSDELLPFLEADLEFGAAAEEIPIWVPSVPQIPPSNLGIVQYEQGFGAKEASQNQPHHGVKAGRNRWSEDSFMVPQINQSSSKRPRPSSSSSLWYF